MKTITRSDIEHVIGRKGYKFFRRGTFNLNIIGIRSTNSVSDKFDDEIHVLYNDEDGAQMHEIFACTTDPGKHWLMNPLNINGTIMIAPGQHRGVYKIGKHGRSKPSGGYVALEQIKPMAQVRDNNKNSKLDFDLYKDESNIKYSLSKTNIHRASKWKTLLNIGRYSAGCQVIQDPNRFDRFMDLCQAQLDNKSGTTFTYTLLEEKDF